MRNLIPNINNTGYLYNPVSLQHKQNTPNKYFLFAALFNTNKGCDILIKAFAKIAHKYPDWKIVLCGSGNYKPQIDRLIKDYALFQQVELPGWIQDDQKHKYYQNAYAYCMCSYLEGLPMSVLEAMSCGVPVIASDVGAVKDMIGEGGGLTIKPKSVEDIISSLNKMSSQEIRRQMSTININKVKNFYTMDAVMKQFLNIYSSCDMKYIYKEKAYESEK